MRVVACLGLLGMLAGCQSGGILRRDAAEIEMFGPAAMRIHPIFTQLKDWTGDGGHDGIEALVEFQDQFGDPTKASGTVTFELFEYRLAMPDPRGERLALWQGSIANLEEQRSRWNRTLRTYTYQLTYPQISASRSYVLSATFQSPHGGRFFDQLVLEAIPEDSGATTQPTTQPTTRTTQPAGQP